MTLETGPGYICPYCHDDHRPLCAEVMDEIKRLRELLKEAKYQLEVCRPFDAANCAHDIGKVLGEE